MTSLENFSPPPHPKTITLDGHLVRLVRLNAEQHAKPLFHANTQDGGSENWTYLPYGPFDTITDYTQWLKTIDAQDDPCFLPLSGKLITGRLALPAICGSTLKKAALRSAIFISPRSCKKQLRPQKPCT